jgi:bla regulator protein blaR1
MALLTESNKTKLKGASSMRLRDCKFTTLAKASLCIAVGLSIALLFTSGFGSSLRVRAQSKKASDDALPSFEVVSIRPSRPGDKGVWASDTSRFAVTAVTARYLIEYAYNDFTAGAILRDDQLVGGPAWINSDKWAINAKVDDRVAEKLRKLTRVEEGKEKALMVRSMLADRFKLQIHHETRIRAVYGLVVSKGGPKFLNTQFTGTDVNAGQLKGPGGKPLPPVTPGLRRFWLHGPVSHLAELLSRIPGIGRLVLDQTGIQGNYDFVFQWKPEPEHTSMLARPGDAGLGSGAEMTNNVAGPSIFTALQEQLGLKLKPEKVPVDVIVIDHIEPPTPN